MRSALLLLLLAACAGQATRAGWLDLQKLPRATGKEGTPAVVLFKSDYLLIHPAYGRFEYTRWRHQEATQLLTEAGVMKRARIVLPFPDGTEVEELRARAVDPDGTVHELDPKAIMQEQATTDEEHQWKVKVSQVPAAKVGSIVEVAYTLRFDHATPGWSEQPAETVPVKHYETEIEVDSRVRWALRTYNSHSSFQKDRDGDLVRFRWSVDDLPALEHDGYAPHWTVASPWWTYRTKQVVFGSSTYDVFNDWADAFLWNVEKLGPSSKLADEPPPPVGAGCGATDVACRVGAALEETRKTPLGKARGLSVARNVSEVRSSGWASAPERTLLLLRALRSAGVRARPAFVNILGGTLVDPQFPRSDAWDWLAIVVPVQPGLQHAIWLDPSCELCGPGDVRPELAGADAMVVDADETYERNDDVRVDHVKVEARPIASTVLHRRYAVRLDPSGGLSLAVDLDKKGADAVWSRAHTHFLSSATSEKAAKKWVARRAPNGRMTRQVPLSCKPDEYDCTRRIELAVGDVATATGDTIALPLTFVSSDWDDVFLENERHSDIVVASPRRYEDEVTLEIPAGWKVKDLPAPAHREAPALSVDIAASSDGKTIVVRRVLTLKVGIYEKDTYPADQEALRPYRDLRHSLLVLTKDPPGP